MSIESFGRDEFLNAAREVILLIHSHAAYATDGSVYWRQPSTSESRPALLGPHLYPGTAGIALLLAACERVLGGGMHRDLCLRGLAPLRQGLDRIIDDPSRANNVQHPIGGLSGIGSLIYSLVTIGDLLDEPTLFQDAHDLSALITPERIARDDELDVMVGSAGAILALLALDRQKPGKNRNGVTPLDIALACARHLEERRSSYQGKPRAWTGPEGGAPAGGFCHGAAGICCALLRLYERTGDPDLWQVAQEGLSYERTLFVPGARNWRLAGQPGLKFSNTWCKGAPGIALGRIAALGVCEDQQSLRDIQAALEVTRSPSLDDRDHICCGNMGRVDVLIYAHRRLGDPELMENARDLAERVLEGARIRGWYKLMVRDKPFLDLRFFPGITGIGYAWLRLASPEEIPCIPALE